MLKQDIGMIWGFCKKIAVHDAGYKGRINKIIVP